MKKIFLLTAFCLVSSCYGELNSIGCGYPSAYKTEEAKSMYNTFGTSIVDMTPQRARQIFGCYYNNGDKVYVYKTFWGEKFILVRYGKPITYYENQTIVRNGAIEWNRTTDLFITNEVLYP